MPASSPMCRSSARPISARTGAVADRARGRGDPRRISSSASTPRGLAEVVVTRASRTITAQEISTPHRAGAGKANTASAKRSNITRRIRPRRCVRCNVEPNVTGELATSCASAYDPRTTAFRRDARPAVEHGRCTGSCAALFGHRHRDRRGRRCRSSDGARRDTQSLRCRRSVRRPKAEGSRHHRSAQRRSGLPPGIALQPGQPLHAADLMKPALVQRNDVVTIVYEAPGITSHVARTSARRPARSATRSTCSTTQSKRMRAGRRHRCRPGGSRPP